jgi:hypothetical protein
LKNHSHPLAVGALRMFVPAAAIAALLTVVLFVDSSSSAQTECGSGNHSTSNMNIKISRGDIPCDVAIPVMEIFLGRSHPSFEVRDDARIEYFTRATVDGRVYDKDKYIFYCEYNKPKADHNYKFGGDCDNTEGQITARPRS